MRQLGLIASATSQDGYQSTMERLQAQLGTVAEIDVVATSLEEELDHEGLNELRGLGALS